MTDPDALVAAGEAWLSSDPDPDTRAELQGVLQAATAGVAGADRALIDMFSGMLEFGTAGLRGPIGAGPNAMNVVMVRRAAWAIGQHLMSVLAAKGDTTTAPRVVIGFDARHKSDLFARESARVLTAYGVDVTLFPAPLPTPVLAYATRAWGADAGIQVTASHNPARDNGYKVYLGERITPDSPGSQLVGPHDKDIHALMKRVDVADIEVVDAGWTTLEPGFESEYIEKVAALVPAAEGELAKRRAHLRVVLTPIHGVGDATVRAVLSKAGFADLTTVPEQQEPDPDFPTVYFPNPEEPGAMDLALKLADTVHADVVIANDPDTDRCAVATIIDGDWQMLHGDVVGSLLGEIVARRRARLKMAPGAQVLANSIVSSRQLLAIAQAHGLASSQTLTGFKWISRAPGLVYGYEEALGYCVAPELVRDKDGISAALYMAEFVAELKAQGRTLADAIDDLAREHGVYLTRQVSARFDDLAVLQGTVNDVLATPPTSLGGEAVTSTDNMADGFRGLPGTTGLHLATESGARVIIRPSGTEPKVKAYLEVIRPVEGGDVASARAAAAHAMDALEADVKTALGV